MLDGSISSYRNLTNVIVFHGVLFFLNIASCRYMLGLLEIPNLHTTILFRFIFVKHTPSRLLIRKEINGTIEYGAGGRT